jgi:hypothetical protein
MASELPIACSLPAEAAAERLDSLERLAHDALIASGRTREGIELRFRADEEVEQALLSFIEAERQCCAFLDFELTRGSELRLWIGGPQDAEPVLDAFLRAATT